MQQENLKIIYVFKHGSMIVNLASNPTNASAWWCKILPKMGCYKANRIGKLENHKRFSYYLVLIRLLSPVKLVNCKVINNVHCF